MILHDQIIGVLNSPQFISMLCNRYTVSTGIDVKIKSCRFRHVSSNFYEIFKIKMSFETQFLQRHFKLRMVRECLLGPKTFERKREFQVIEYFTSNGLKPFLQSIEH